MVSTKHPRSVLATGKRPRKRYDPARRREVAKTRELGACTDCRRRKVRCHHAQGSVNGEGFPSPESLSPEPSTHLNTTGQPTLESRAVRDNGSGTHGDLRGGTPPLESQFGDDGIMPFYDVESYASQTPMFATTQGFAVAASSPPAASSNTWNTLQPMDEISSRYMVQAMHESSCSDTLSYPRMCNWVGSPEVWAMAPSLYPYPSQMSSSHYPPRVPEFDGLEADHALLTPANAYPQDGRQWPTGYEYPQATTLYPTINFDHNTSPNTSHTAGNSDIVSTVTVLSSGNTIDNSCRDQGVSSTGSQHRTGSFEQI